MAGVDGPVVRDSFLRDPTMLTELRQRAESTQPIGDLVLGPFKGRDEMLAEFEQRRGRMMAAAGDVVLPSDTSRTTYYGSIQPLPRKIRLLDLVPTAAMGSGAFDIFAEAYTSGAAETSESASSRRPVHARRHHRESPDDRRMERISRPTFADVPGLANSIDQLLRWDVEQRLEAEML